MTELVTSAPQMHPITYDPNLRIVSLVRIALGPDNLGQMNKRITARRFPLTGIGMRTTMAGIVPFRNNEWSDLGATRLMSAGYILGNHGDLAAYLREYPWKVACWGLVAAISEDARWMTHSLHVQIPTAFVSGKSRMFNLRDFRYKFNSFCGILVVSSPPGREG